MGPPKGGKGPPALSAYGKGRGSNTAGSWRRDAAVSRVAQARRKHEVIAKELEAFRTAHIEVKDALALEDDWQPAFQSALAKLLPKGLMLLQIPPYRCDAGLPGAIEDFKSALELIDKYRASLPENVLLFEEEMQSEYSQTLEQCDFVRSLVLLPEAHESWLRIQGTQLFTPPLRLGEPLWPKHALRVICISDTHTRHEVFGDGLPQGDILLHAGDCTDYGYEQEVLDTLNFLERQNHTHKILIGGNHDLCMHGSFYTSSADEWPYKQLDHPDERGKLSAAVRRRLQDSSVIYLEDELASGLPSGLAVYGSPWSPYFGNWAFNVPRGELSKELYRKVPTPCDVLVTHGPPLGRGDAREGDGIRLGCADLLDEIQSRIKPRVHVFGHVHEVSEEARVTSDGCTAFVNATTCTYGYCPLNPPVVFDLPWDRKEAPRFLQPSLDWAADRVAEWWRGEGMPQWAEVFEAEAINGAMINSMDEELFKRLRDAYKQQIKEPEQPEDCRNLAATVEEALSVMLRAIHRLRIAHYK